MERCENLFMPSAQTLPQGNFHFTESFAFCVTAHHGRERKGTEEGKSKLFLVCAFLLQRYHKKLNKYDFGFVLWGIDLKILINFPVVFLQLQIYLQSLQAL